MNTLMNILNNLAGWRIRAGLGAMLFALMVSSAPAQGPPCLHERVLTSLLSAAAGEFEATIETLTDPSEIGRYLDVINEVPPTAGKADQLLLLVHPVHRSAWVWLVHQQFACENYVIAPELHAKAWQAAKGFVA